MGNAKPRPRAVPAIAVETIVTPPGTPEPKEPAVRAALDSIQRSFDKVGEAAASAAMHPTLRDQVVELRMANGNNVVNHGLGRAPRFVYVTLLEVPNIVNWAFQWVWNRRDAATDRGSVLITTVATLPAPVYEGVGSTTIISGGVLCRVRVE